VLLPQTYGPFNSRISRLIARWILLHSSAIHARDQQGVETLGPLLGERFQQVVYCPDVAFTLRAERPRDFPVCGRGQQGSRSSIVGFNVNGLMYNGGHTRKNMFGLRMDYRKLVTALLLALMEEQAIELLLVPHTYGTPGIENDSDVSEK